MPSDAAKVVPSRALVRRLADGGVPIVMPVPALARFHEVMVDRMRLGFEDAVSRLAEWCMLGEMAVFDPAVLDGALDCAADGAVSMEQAVLLACAAAARCDLLVTATAPDRFAWRDITVADPFAPLPEPRLEPYLGPSFIAEA